MTEPPPLASSSGMPCLQTTYTPMTLTASTVSQTFSSLFVTELSSLGKIPALLYRTSSFPKALIAAATPAFTSASFATFIAIATALPPADCAVCTTRWTASRFMSQAATLAPSRAKRTVASAPMPEPAPVIKTTLPASRPPVMR